MSKIVHLDGRFSIASYDLIKQCDALELRFYLWLKLWAIDQNKHCAWPSYATICTELDIDATTLVRLIKKMETKKRLDR